jgi:hypothetical protein
VFDGKRVTIEYGTSRQRDAGGSAAGATRRAVQRSTLRPSPARCSRPSRPCGFVVLLFYFCLTNRSGGICTQCLGGVGAANTVVTTKTTDTNLLFAPGIGYSWIVLKLTFLKIPKNIARTFEFAFDAPLTPFELECLHVVLQLVSKILHYYNNRIHNYNLQC